MTPHHLTLVAIFFFSVVAPGEGLLPPQNPTCHVSNDGDHGSTLQLIHANSPCSPLSPKTTPFSSWSDSVLQMQSSDKLRLQFLASLAAGRSIAPIASGRAVTQNPTYVVRAKIGTPPQTLFVAVDTSNDAAWIPCFGCVGCSSVTFNPALSSSFKTVPCAAAQCSQVCMFI